MPYKKIFYTGLITYLILIVLSVIYFRERTILMDSAFDIFHYLRQSIEEINLTRLAGQLPKIPALIFARIGMPVNMVLIAYSVGFSGYYLLCYSICGLVLKRYDFAIIILLCNTLFVTETFYYIPSELPAGIAFIMLFFAFISDKRISKLRSWEKIFIIVGALSGACFHPLILIVLLYCLVFFVLNNKIIADIKLLFCAAAIFFLAIPLKYLLIKTQYDAHAMGGLKNFVTLFPNYFNIYANRHFLHQCTTVFYWIPITVLLIICVYIGKKQWKMLIFFLATFFGYLALINISYPDNVTPTFYFENLYLPLSVFLAMPLVFHILPLVNKRYSWIAIVLITGSGCARICRTHSLFADRLNWERNVIQQYAHRKVLIDNKVAHADMLQMLWATPFEMLLLSLSDGHEPASIIIDDKLNRPWVSAVNKSLVVNWNVYSYQTLPVRYFPFKDSASSYTIIK